MMTSSSLSSTPLSMMVASKSSFILSLVVFALVHNHRTATAFPQLAQPSRRTFQKRQRQIETRLLPQRQMLQSPQSRVLDLMSSTLLRSKLDEDDEEYFYLTSTTRPPSSVNEEGGDVPSDRNMNDDSLRFMMMMSTMRSSQDGTTGSGSRNSNKKEKSSSTSLSASSSEEEDEGELVESSSSSSSSSSSISAAGSLVQDTLQPPSINWKRGSILFDESPFTAYSETQRGLEYWLWCQQNIPPVLTGIWPWRSDDAITKTNEHPWQAMYNMLLVRLPAVCLLLYIISHGIMEISHYLSTLDHNDQTADGLFSIVNWNTISSSSLISPAFIIFLLIFVVA